MQKATNELVLNLHSYLPGIYSGKPYLIPWHTIRILCVGPTPSRDNLGPYIRPVAHWPHAPVHRRSIRVPHRVGQHMAHDSGLRPSPERTAEAPTGSLSRHGLNCNQTIPTLGRGGLLSGVKGKIPRLGVRSKASMWPSCLAGALRQPNARGRIRRQL